MKTVLLAIAAWVLAACASPTPQDFASQAPAFDFKTYFNGKVDGWGMIQDRSGKVTKRMYVEMTGTWNGDVGTLDEQFTNSDGTKETRVWTVRKSGNRYVGTAGDVVGEATGEAAGNALNWKYVLDAKRENGERVKLDMDDWMWMIDDRTLMNRTKFSKFGIGFGEVTFTFRKRG